MIRTRCCWLVIAAACGGILGSVLPADAQVIGGIGAGLNGFRPAGAVHLPVRPVLPGPIYPTPIVPAYPWYRTRIHVYPPVYPYGNYYYPPTRWDAPAWDGRSRNVEPQPQPRKPAPPPERPRVLEWNAATGQADVRDFNRWDKPATSAPAKQDSPQAYSPDTQSLHRWDDPSQ